jgi:UDP-2,3-diacylglucosamine pyrophosphatase LpxH
MTTLSPVQLLELGIKKKNKEIESSWQELADKYSNGLFHTGEAFRCWVKNRLRSDNSNAVNAKKNTQPINEPTFKDTVEINKDGSQSSNKLVRMSIEDSKDPTYLLRAHGYASDEWELVSAKSKVWNSYSKQDGIVQLYASSITVKPLTSGFSMVKLLEEIKRVPPIYVKGEYKSLSNKRLLEIPLFDSHFGISDLDYYKPTQDEIMDKIQSRTWAEIVFVIGQDMLHNDNFKGQTANGTPIETVNMPNAWRDAMNFYYPLIEKALTSSNKVKIIYSKGNHDESMSWAFVQLIKQRFPEAEIDDDFIERKAHTFGNVFIGVTHGDKARKNLHNLFQVEFPLEWANATTREIHSGHLHTEDARDWFGTMVRTLSTRNKTDKWHADYGYVGNHKRFMLFEYDETELKSIHYV